MGMFHFPMFVFCSRMFVRYNWNLEKLAATLRDFSVRSTRCFCCDCDHVHPETKQKLPCDRQLVYDTIAYWHGANNLERGLDAFDHLVRRHLMDYMTQSLGQWSTVPYSFAVSASMFPALGRLDGLVASSNPTFLQALLAVDAGVLRHPLNIAVVVSILRLWASRLQRRFGKPLTVLGFGVLSTLIYFVTLGVVTALYDANFQAWTGRPTLCMLIWMSFEAAVL